MAGQPNKSSESAQFRVRQILYKAGLILLSEYLTLFSSGKLLFLTVHGEAGWH
jgi:hypothetical protein